MTYNVVLEESDEGFAVSVPGLPGCCSQGDTEGEALENIADAIRVYLEVQRELANTPTARLGETHTSNSLRKAREGWEESAAEMHRRGDDKLLLGDFPNEWDKTEWEW